MKQPELVSTPSERAPEPPNNIEAWLQRASKGAAGWQPTRSIARRSPSESRRASVMTGRGGRTAASTCNQGCRPR